MYLSVGTYLVNLACALLVNDVETCAAQARSLIHHEKVDTDSYRMFSAVARIFHSPVAWYSHGPIQKRILRQIRIMDSNLMKQQAAVDQRGATFTLGKDMNIALLMLYGQILYASSSYSFALSKILYTSNFLLKQLI
jgi:general transcription factor 3C polypeptide 3 (transcription factor C subunit 4)